MSQTSEEKTLPPSDKKLREARKRGQISKGRDMPGAVIMLCTVACVGALMGQAYSDYASTLSLTLDGQNGPYYATMYGVIVSLLSVSASLCLKLFATVVFSTILINIVLNKGFIFALDPIKPKIENINPADGFKRLFSMKSLMEVIKSALKTLVYSVAVAIAIIGLLNTLFNVPSCGVPCFIYSFTLLMERIGLAAVVIFFVFGAADLLIQKWLFLRDMRMTKTEAKRERIDQEGNPQIRSAHRRMRREMLQGEPVGLARASVIIYGPDAVVGFRYVPGVTKVPTLVCRATAENALPMLSQARDANIPVFEDASTARVLAKTVRVGAPLPAQHFNNVARALYVTGVVS